MLRIVALALPIVAVAMAIYQLAYTQILIQSPTAHRITHLGFAMAVVFFSLLLRGKRGRLANLGLLFTSVVVTGYFMYYLSDILRFRSASPILPDLVMGSLVVLLSFVATYKVWGKTFPMLAAASLAYLVLGRYLPFPFTVAPVPLKMLLVWLGLPGLEEGVYGSILAISANYLFIIILFGALLHAFGGTRFIIAMGRWIGSKLASGPAVVAVVSSSILGTVTGSTVGNIAITGTFTIPMMKEAGYTPEQAGAIEAVASNGGQIMPPIMGATAFIMAGFAGIPYIQIIAAALVPALLYYFAVFFYVQLTAQKMKVKAVVEPVSGRELLIDAPIFFLPLGILVFLLVQGFTLPFVGFWAIMTLILVGLISSIRKEARLNFKEAVEAIVNGVRLGSEIAVSCALIGIVVTSIIVSGLGIKLPLLIQDISGGHLIIALAIAMVSSIILGMGVPTAAAYILVAIGLVPALISMGVPLLQAHFFPFIFAVFSHLTPPVAYGALVASQIAGGNYWKTSWEAIKAAFTAFLLPFFVIYTPIVVLRPEGNLILSITQIVAILLVILSLQMGVSNYCFTPLGRSERFAFIITGLLCLTFVFTQGYFYLFVGTALFVVNISWQFTKRRQLKTTLD